ncbi:MAG: hypothetical protein KKA81_16420, partial [Bacteroidetes bacterium]|nr:hypothetical protein [Bacteroidota bacterium]
FQNADCYFVPGLTWSDVGFYSPTFRLSGKGVFDVKGSRILTGELDRYFLLGLLCSKPVRFFIKAIANHTVSTQVDDIRQVPLPHPNGQPAEQISRLVMTIIDKQRCNRPGADIGREQDAIEQLVCRMYRLTNSQIEEIDRWYAGRYPKLIHTRQE